MSLTGDVDTGKLIARNAADSLKRVHLELGGKAPVVVFDDADIEAVIATLAEAGYYNSGQDCTAPCRVMAGPRRATTTSSPAWPTAVGRHRRRRPVRRGHRGRPGRLRRAAGAGGRAWSPGRWTPVPRWSSAAACWTAPASSTPRRWSPTRPRTPRSSSARCSARSCRVQRFADEDQALAWANGVDYGLAASVWTTDVGRAMRMASRLQFGTVWVNDHIPIVSEMPHGGFKQSGYGKDMSIYAIEHYTELKHVMVKH